ncbi:hypothetical protein VP14_183 [Vibrio phage VPMCC14]|nr:hypothetical protein VP14_183 [Vibrio phage VPMCC14]
MNRSELDNLRGEDLRRMIDPDIEEYEDYLPEVKCIDKAWLLFDKECDLDKSKWDSEVKLLEDQDKELENRRVLEDNLEIEAYEQYLQYHHEQVEIPYWKLCVDNLEKLL